MKQYILMADIIDSGEKNQNTLMIDFKELVKEINHTYHDSILSPLTITLGDEFQGVIKDLNSAVKIIVNLEENIIHKKINFKLRYILNQGEIETPINNKIAYEMLGKGLTDARFKLNNLKIKNCRFHISIENKIQNEILTNTFRIFENIVEKWNSIQDFEIVSNFIKYKDYKIIAKIMNKDRSQIWKREKTLNIESYNSAKNILQIITS